MRPPPLSVSSPGAGAGPGGPFRRTFWRSPLRGPWLTAVFSSVLLVGVVVVFLTGLASYAAYNPRLGGISNDPTPAKGLLGAYLFIWPTRPVWLYRLSQGVHVTLGLVLIPVLLAKLWSVLPKLFEWPPAASVAQALERFTLLLLVGGGIFEFVTGVMDIQLFYAWPFNFYTAHFYGAWVFMAAFTAHAILRMPRLMAALRSRSLRAELRTDTARTVVEPPDPDHLVAPAPSAPTISRRGVLGLVGGSSLSLLVLTAGQTLGGPFRRLALLAPHGQSLGPGPNDFQVNKTAAYRGITAETVGPAWRLELRGARTVLLSRPRLLELPQHTYELPIACVEGWSTTQTWTGVRLRDLAALAGAPEAESVSVESLQRGGSFGSAVLARNQLHDERSLLALRVNGAALALDHGFPARVVVPAAPGVHQTKWVARMTFRTHG